VIRLTGKPGDPNHKIQFTPRQKFSKAETLEFELVYGHACTRCFNVVQAMFITDRPVDLYKYEETAVISLAQDPKKFGTINKYVPEYEDPVGTTCYTSTPLSGGEQRAQHLVLKNHVLRFEGIDKPKAENGAQYFEKGERTCEYTGFFSVRKDLLVRDILSFMQVKPEYIKGYHYPPLEEFLQRCGDRFRTLPAYGDAPPVVLVKRENMQFGMQSTLSEIMKDFTNKHNQEKAASAQ
jgi:hypothetical protein